MEMSPPQRRLTFGLIVLVLAGLVVYLVGTAVRGTSGSPGHAARAGSPNPTAAVPSPSGSAPGSPAPSQGLGASSADYRPDIYQWLPFTQAGLAAAASVAQRFGVAYGTFSYTESASAYGASLQPLSSPSLAGQVEAAYSLPGVAAARASSRQVSAGTAAIESIRAFGPSSITFIVEITEHQIATTGSSDATTSYAMTLTGSGSSWQVTDIELSDLGNS
jgi:hypothetical protein